MEPRVSFITLGVADLERSERRIGSVSKLWRYPVKSMLGEACERLELDARGVHGDRRFALRDADGKLGSGKSTRRFRHIEGLFAFGAVREQIVFPDGRRMACADPAIHQALSAALAVPVTLAREDGISHLDSGPVHLVTTASMRWLQALLPDSRIDERRFRPNIVVEVPGERPVEQDWLGKTLYIGKSAKIRVSHPTERCQMTTFAQADLPVDPRVLTRIGRDADLRFGVYAEVVAPGSIACGDPIFANARGIQHA
ncbi:MAG: MOSC domain-containing protein [Burkholderiales bacterium]